MKAEDLTPLLEGIAWNEGFWERVVLMPCVCCDVTALLALQLKSRGAKVFYGYSDFDSHTGSKTDARQLNGLRTFYRMAAAENARIDLCVHCLARQPSLDAGQTVERGLDFRTVFIGTLLAVQHIKTKAGVGTILNLH